MTDNVISLRQCPICGKMYGGVPAVSRSDSRNLICPDCGTREALDSLGIDLTEQEQILECIHRRSVTATTGGVSPQPPSPADFK